MRLEQIATAIDARLQGDPELEITGVGALQDALPGQLSFIAQPGYRDALTQTRASAVVLTEEYAALCPGAALVCKAPYLGFARAAQLLHPPPMFTAGIHPTAHIGQDCHIDPSAHIGAFAVLGRGCHIEADVYIGPHCILDDHCHIGAKTRLIARVVLGQAVKTGERCLMHPGAVIGADGFGFAPSHEGWVKIPQLGSVILGCDVEIGANTTVDCGAMGNTVLEDGVKLDNLVQIGHNVHIGAHSIIAGCAGVAGSARIGRHCAIAGGVGVLGHITITDYVTVTAMTFVSESISEPGVYASGMPHQSARRWNRSVAHLRRLDNLALRVRKLEKQ